jgi:hypothetical protein
MQEIEDLRNKEKKHLLEIEYLKSQIGKQVVFLGNVKRIIKF